jgi:hypothetical protein
MGLKFEPKKFKFGMRTLKTGIAVFLVLGLFSALGWEGLQIGCLTAVFSLRENFDRSIQFGKSRIFANTVGGLLSLLFYFVNMWFNHSVWVTSKWFTCRGIDITNKTSYCTIFITPRENCPRIKIWVKIHIRFVDTNKSLD